MVESDSDLWWVDLRKKIPFKKAIIQAPQKSNMNDPAAHAICDFKKGSANPNSFA